MSFELDCASVMAWSWEERSGGDVGGYDEHEGHARLLSGSHSSGGSGDVDCVSGHHYFETSSVLIARSVRSSRDILERQCAQA